MTDKQTSGDLRIDEVAVGDVVRGFLNWGCVPANAARVVQRAANGDLFVRCQEGRHYLDGQVGDDGCLVGIRKVEK
jgi:hypothetical protein